mgnify:CR=1 FL=1
MVTGAPPLTEASTIIKPLVPWFATEITIALSSAVVPVNWTPVILSSSVAMNPIVSAPIHAATAMLTATVTAMSMIDATTGLSAFLLRLKFFIFFFQLPFLVIEVW